MNKPKQPNKILEARFLHEGSQSSQQNPDEA